METSNDIEASSSDEELWGSEFADCKESNSNVDNESDNIEMLAGSELAVQDDIVPITKTSVKLAFKSADTIHSPFTLQNIIEKHVADPSYPFSDLIEILFRSGWYKLFVPKNVYHSCIR
jgi:hypothetical protein